MVRITIAALVLLTVACTGQPAGGILPAGSPAVRVAQQWAQSIQGRDRVLFEATLNPARLARPDNADAFAWMRFSEALIDSFARCGMEEPVVYGMLTDSTHGRERYMAIGRYSTPCVRDGDAPPTDTFVVHELTLDGTPKVDGWSFGRPPGM